MRNPLAVSCFFCNYMVAAPAVKTQLCFAILKWTAFFFFYNTFVTLKAGPQFFQQIFSLISPNDDRHCSLCHPDFQNCSRTMTGVHVAHK